MKVLIAVISLLIASSAYGHAENGADEPNHLLDESPSLSFRLFSAADPSLCLLEVKQAGERRIVQWSKNCADQNSVFLYEDGGGYESFTLPSGSYVTFVIRTDLSKDLSTALTAENLFFANTITQEEFVNGMAANLFIQDDGTYLMGNYDEEEPAPMSVCVSGQASGVKTALGSALLVASENDTKACARLVLKKI